MADFACVEKIEKQMKYDAFEQLSSWCFFPTFEK
jgi:hypothetical protein